MALAIDDPRWFPIDYDLARRAFVMREVELERIGEAAFLDQRMGVSLEGAREIPAARLAGADPSANPAFLFHTAFCGSTLLARALHAPPLSVALKEPLVLMKLSAAARAARDADALAVVHQDLDAALALLRRPWTAQGRVLVKPTNVVNSLIPLILRGQRAILLYSSLREFIVSCCKKLPQAETRIRWMAQSLIHGTRLQRALGVPSDHPFNFVESCVLTWHAQIERYALALADDAGDALRTLDMRAMLAAPADAVAASARWMGLDAALQGLEPRVAREFSRNAKSTGEAFDPAQREREKRGVLVRYARLVEVAVAWAGAEIEPHTPMPQDWKPLPIGNG